MCGTETKLLTYLYDTRKPDTISLIPNLQILHNKEPVENVEPLNVPQSVCRFYLCQTPFITSANSMY